MNIRPRSTTTRRLFHPMGVVVLFFLIMSACSSIPNRPEDDPSIVQTSTAENLVETPEVDQPTRIPTLLPTLTPTNPPTPVAVILQDAVVSRLAPSVFTGMDFPLREVQVDDPFNLQAGGFVTTDINGEADVTIQDCLKLFIFQDSTLQRKTCRKSDAASGLGVCTSGGLTGVLNTCSSQVAIQTPGSEVITKGTWFTVIYLPEDNLSIVQVYEGAVDVSAVLGESTDESTPGLELQAGNLWFTSPGADAPVIAGITGREAQPMEVWQALRPELIAQYPLLDKWLNSASEKSQLYSLPFPEFLARPQGEVNINFEGRGWNENSLENGIFIGVPWSDLILQSWFDLAITPRLFYNDLMVEDARVFEPQLDQAQKTLTSEGFDSKSIQIALLDTDFSSQIFAEELQAALGNIGIKTSLTYFTEGDLKIAIDQARKSDDPPFLWIDVSGEAFQN